METYDYNENNDTYIAKDMSWRITRKKLGFHDYYIYYKDSSCHCRFAIDLMDLLDENKPQKANDLISNDSLCVLEGFLRDDEEENVINLIRNVLSW